MVGPVGLRHRQATPCLPSGINVLGADIAKLLHHKANAGVMMVMRSVLTEVMLAIIPVGQYYVSNVDWKRGPGSQGGPRRQDSRGRLLR